LKSADKDETEDSLVSDMESIKRFQDIFGSRPFSFSATKHQGSNESFLCVLKDCKWEAAEAKPMGY
jgi:hypothetical protein